MRPSIFRFLALLGAGLLWAGHGLAAVSPLAMVPYYYPGAAAPVWKVGDNLLLMREYDFGAAYDLARVDPATGVVTALKDINPGSAADIVRPDLAVTHQDMLYFWVSDPVHGLSLWRTDGTTAGTVFFMDLLTEQGLAADAIPLQMVNLDEQFLLVLTNEGSSATNKLWRIDPATGAVVRLGSALPGAPSSYQRVGDTVQFQIGNTLWSAEGSPDSAAAISGAWFYGPFVALAGKSLVIRNNALQEVNLANGMLTPLNTPNPYGDGWQDIALKVGNRFLFDTVGSSIDDMLWISDGSAAGTFLLTSRLPWYAKIALRFKGGALYPSHSFLGSFDLHWVNGATGSSSKLATLAPGEDYYPLRMMQAGNLAFVLKHSACCVRLWTTDGTADGTHLVFSSARRPDQSWDLVGGSDERFYLSLTDYAATGISRLYVYTPGTAAGGGGGGGAAEPWLLLPLLALAWGRRRRRRREDFARRG